MTAMKNYMDKFESPEDFIKFQITANMGTNNVIDKIYLAEIARSKGVKVVSKMTKLDIYNALREKISLEEIMLCCGGIGVSSYSFQLKFDITNDEVKRMARLGYIQVTGSERFRAYGKYRNADTYSVFDYFRLTKEEVHDWLVANPKGTRRKKKLSP